MITATDKQSEVLSTIISMKQNKGYSPTFREIADEMNITTGCAYDYVMALKRKGYLEHTEGVSRSIVIKRLPEDI